VKPVRVAPTTAAAVLTGLPDVTHARLRKLLRRWPDPTEALDAVARGAASGCFEPPVPVRTLRTWQACAADAGTIAAIEATLRVRGTRVLLAGGAGFPIDPELIPDHPAILLAEGERADAFDAPRVAIVGTRAATPHGLDDARELAADLAAAGVTVVSGLAIGIDAAAHQGALDAGGLTVGVVATGMDLEYPRRHRSLYAEVRRSGVVLGESGFGTRPEPHRFPPRNRIIAAVADITVVVEATVKGGARITAEHALRYGRDVFAIPGSRRNAAAEGCNELIRDGAHPLLRSDDVLLRLGCTPGSRRRSDPTPVRLPLEGDSARVLEAFAGEPATPDQLAHRCDLDVGAVALALCALARDGWARADGGHWWPA
jgi:DNA processing protein